MHSTGDDMPGDHIGLSEASVTAYLGYLAFVLPVVLLALGPLASVCRMASISHYFYVPIIGEVLLVTTGVLAGLLTLLSQGTHGSYWHVAAAVCLVFAAVFPISGDGCAQTAYTGISFYTYNYADPSQSGLSHDLRFRISGHVFSNIQLHFLANFGLAIALVQLCLLSQPRGARASLVARLAAATIILCTAAFFADLHFDEGQIDGFNGLFPPMMLLQSAALMAFGVAMVTRAMSMRAVPARATRSVPRHPELTEAHTPILVMRDRAD
jgi:hypothetical protein